MHTKHKCLILTHTQISPYLIVPTHLLYICTVIYTTKGTYDTHLYAAKHLFVSLTLSLHDNFWSFYRELPRLLWRLWNLTRVWSCHHQAILDVMAGKGLKGRWDQINSDSFWKQDVSKMRLIIGANVMKLLKGNIQVIRYLDSTQES